MGKTVLNASDEVLDTPTRQVVIATPFTAVPSTKVPDKELDVTRSGKVAASADLYYICSNCYSTIFVDFKTDCVCIVCGFRNCDKEE